MYVAMCISNTTPEFSQKNNFYFFHILNVNCNSVCNITFVGFNYDSISGLGQRQTELLKLLRILDTLYFLSAVERIHEDAWVDLEFSVRYSVGSGTYPSKV